MAQISASIGGAYVSLMTAAVTGAVAAGQPVPLEVATWGGVKLAHLMFGAVGCAITLSMVQGWSWGQVAKTMATGLGAAAFATPYALHYFGPPEAIAAVGESAYAAAFGAVGVYLIPGLRRAAEAVSANPWGFVDWWRGRGAPPQPPQPPGPPSSNGGNP